MNRILNRTFRAGVVLGTLLLLSGGPGVSDAAAQRASIDVYPRQGPPGTVVRVTGRNLPPGMHVDIAASTSAYGMFRPVGRAFTDGGGGFTVSLTIPRNVREGQRLVFAVFAMDRRVSRTSREFRVIAGEPVEEEIRPGSVVELTGLLSAVNGNECLLLTTMNDGEEASFWLTGDFRNPPIGSVVRARGMVSETTLCGEGTTVVVVRLEPVEEDHPSSETEPGTEGGEEALDLEGTITDEGVECIAMRTDDGTLYTLVGELPELSPGDRVSVNGRSVEFSICMQGATVHVDRIERTTKD
jgi:hypothetical protein